MDVRDGFIGIIGNTPLIRLHRVSEQTGCEILGKAEFLNPGSSVKDRAALFIIKDAEQRGALEPGGLIVEGTAGNTGIGLALCGNALGYRTLIVIPETQSQEKKDMLRLCGAELKEVPAVPYRNPNNYVHVAERLAKEMAKTEQKGVLYANQWDNTANRRAHYEGTGPEIWRQTGGNSAAILGTVYSFPHKKLYTVRRFRNFLHGRHGDHANAVLTAVGYNFRLILKWLKALLRLILDAILDVFAARTAVQPAS